MNIPLNQIPLAQELAMAAAEQLQQQVAQLTEQVQLLTQRVGARRPGGQRITQFGNEDDESWTVWKNHFLNVSRLNGFTDLEQRLALAGAMKGKAALATLDINVEEPVGLEDPTIDNVMGLYQARFLPAAASQLARVKFDMARQGTTESILNFHGRLRAVYNEAYPDAADHVLLIRKFITGLKRRELRMQAMRIGPETYAEALEAAQNESSVQQLAKIHELGAAPAGDEPMEIGAMQPNQNNATNNNNNSNSAPRFQKGKCHFCQKNGHWKRDCGLLKKTRQYQANKGRSDHRSGGGQPYNRQAIVAALEMALHNGDGDGSSTGAATPSGSGAEAATSAGQTDF